jgi:hypothetical protein
MARRRSTLWVAVLCAIAVAAPPPAAGAEPRPGRLGAGLQAAAAGRLSDRAIVSRVRDGQREIAVAVELAEEPGAAIRGRLRAAGLDLRGSWRGTIEGYVRANRLARLAATPGVLAVRAIRRPLPATFVGPAPALHGATPWHQAGLTGRGVKVGIIDTSFDGFAARLGSELPATVQALCFAQLGVASPNLTDCVTPGDTHGTAVAESMVDMAPGVQLFVSNAFSQADMARAVTWMTGNGVRVINYSLGSLEGMGDGTSPYVASTYALVDEAVAGGALFVASAGNEGQRAWMGPPNDANGNGWIEFAGLHEHNTVTLSAGEQIEVALRWPSASSDYDIALYQGQTIVASSADYQTVTGDPFELLTYEATSAGDYDLRVWHYSGPAAPLMRMVMMWASAGAMLAHHTTAGSLSTPADSRNPGLVSVGAVHYQRPTAIEPYSSQGPTLDGRIKPDLVAAACAPTTIEPEFCGTSQAAPFVSGAAALHLEADPTLTPAALAARLRERAAPLGSPVPNNTFGHGRLALGAIPTPVPAAATFVAPPASGTAAGPLLGQPTVAIVDAGGRVAATGPGATMPVTLTLASNPAGATLTCDGGLTRAAVSGLAAFTGCSVSLAGAGYTIRADVPGLASATSAPFAVGAPDAPPQVAIAVSPTTVAFGRPITATVAVAPPEGPGLATTIEWSPDATTWTSAGEVTLDLAGAGSLSAEPRRHGRWRARTMLPDGSVAVSAAVAVSVSATAGLASSVRSGRTITRTTRITLTHTGRPAGPDVARGRARFDIFQQVGTDWVRRRTILAWADPATGRARITTTLPSSGRWWIRSRAERTATNGPSPWTNGVRYWVR